jgi:esterase FrsA
VFRPLNCLPQVLQSFRVPAGFFPIILLFIVTVSFSCFAEEHAERTIEEIKTEAVHRAEVGQYPLIGLNADDVREAFKSVHTRDKDEWANAFMGVADRYMNEAKSLEKTDPTKANADYIRAWRLYSFGRWPIPASPAKQRSYEKALEAFREHAKFWDPPMEIVKIPFEGKEIIGYLRLPKNATGPVPLVLAVNGLDSRKEDLAESFSAILNFGIGYLAVDGPGTGQNPIKVSETADRMLSRVLDYIATRPEIDKNRVAMHGVSWGAYWAAKMAIVERARLKGASAQSPPVDTFFQKEFLTNSLIGNREYLFDQVPALMAIFDNVHSDRRDGGRVAEDVAHQTRLARQADGSDAHSGRRERHAGADLRYLSPDEQRRRAEDGLGQSPGRPFGPTSWRVARSAHFQGSHHSVAGAHAGSGDREVGQFTSVEPGRARRWSPHNLVGQDAPPSPKLNHLEQATKDKRP